MMLRHLGQHAPADAIERAVLQTISDGIKPRDLQGEASSAEFAEAVIARL
jgi:isocitrate/isopropylmalate dehydrogenase